MPFSRSCGGRIKRSFVTALTIATGLLTLSACTVAPRTEWVWYKPGATEREMAQDEYECLQQTAYESNPYTRYSAHRLCLASKGWVATKVEVR